MAAFSLFCILSLLFACSYAHMYLNNVRVNGAVQPDGDCIRTRGNNPSTKNYFVPTVTDAQLTCGLTPGSTTPANRMCPIEAGQKLGLQWWWERPGDMVVDVTHRGPCMIYMAKNDGQFNWFKLWEDGYKADAGNDRQFCVDRLRDNGPNGEGKGIMEVTIPTQLAPGNYLVRGETIGLHDAWQDQPQPYVACVEITVTGSGTVNPSPTVKLPGAYSLSDPGLGKYSIYPPKLPYVIPGPAVYNFGSNPAATSSATSTAATSSAATTRTSSATTATSSATTATSSAATSSSPAATSSSPATTATPSTQSSGSCNVGSERCACTAGKGCDSGLSCVSDVCVNIGTAVKGDSSSLSASFAVLFVAVFVALVNIF